MFQLVIIFALLEIDYPPKVEAFFQGFQLAALSMPEEYNFMKRIIPEHILQRE